MFAVSDDEAAAIRTAFYEKGEWLAVAELRRYFPIRDNESALGIVRMIARWPVQRQAGPTSAPTSAPASAPVLPAVSAAQSSS